MLRFILASALIAAPAVAVAQTAAGSTPQRIRSVTITRGQPCPKSTGDEVVVCSTLDEPYRIPSKLREPANPAATQSWVNRQASIDDVSRVAGGLPDTCSPVGTGGQSGCALAINRQFAAEKRAQASGQQP